MKITTTFNDLVQANAECAGIIVKQMEEIESLRDALRMIVEWSKAYPLSVFPEPDLIKASALLEAGGQTLDAISAHAMRHVVEGVGEIAKGALKEV
jgi:hypothetical protein